MKVIFALGRLGHRVAGYAMSTPRVSVVIPAFNRAGTIREAAESVLSQSFDDLELIVVDDGSSDGTLTALEAVSDSRLRVLALRENRGVSVARNRGIDAARAPWVAFQDSDDLWRRDKLARQMALLEAPGADYIAAYCGMEITKLDGGTRYVPDPTLHYRAGDVLPDLVFCSFISTQTLVVRRDVLETVGGFDEDQRALVDWELMLRVAQRGSIGLVDAPLVEQRFSENSITRDAVRRVHALARVVEMHGEVLDRYPGALAARHYELSGGYRHCGDLERAVAHMAEARQRMPLRARWWLAAIWLQVLRVTRPTQPAAGR